MYYKFCIYNPNKINHNFYKAVKIGIKISSRVTNKQNFRYTIFKILKQFQSSLEVLLQKKQNLKI